MSKSNVLNVLLAFLTFFGRYSDGCKCAVVHPQTKYCSADFVIVAIPTKMKTTAHGRDLVYNIKIDVIFKMNTKAKGVFESNYGQIFTSSSSASCGVTLQLNRPQLMLGDITDTRAYLHSCGYNSPLDEIPKFLFRGFKSAYEKGCSCKIENCYGDEACQQVSSIDVCALERSKSPDCYSDFSACRRNSTSSPCQWISSKYLANCFKNQTPVIGQN